MVKYDTQSPFIASYVIVRRGEKVACVLRSHTKWMNGYYTLPSGKVEWNENLLECAKREAFEEIGITVELKDIRHVHTMHRFTGHENSHWIDVFFEVDKYEGEPYNAEPHMHSELAWLDPQSLPDNIVPNVKFALQQINLGNSYSQFGWPDSSPYPSYSLLG